MSMTITKIKKARGDTMPDWIRNAMKTYGDKTGATPGKKAFQE